MHVQVAYLYCKFLYFRVLQMAFVVKSPVKEAVSTVEKLADMPWYVCTPVDIDAAKKAPSSNSSSFVIDQIDPNATVKACLRRTGTRTLIGKSLV